MATRTSFGLDFYQTIFEVVDAEDLNEMAAYGGFPTRYPALVVRHVVRRVKKGYDYGLSKIYEMVINNDPCYAYLMRYNHTVDQKLVDEVIAAHQIGVARIVVDDHLVDIPSP